MCNIKKRKLHRRAYDCSSNLKRNGTIRQQFIVWAFEQLGFSAERQESRIVLKEAYKRAHVPLGSVLRHIGAFVPFLFFYYGIARLVFSLVAETIINTYNVWVDFGPTLVPISQTGCDNYCHGSGSQGRLWAKQQVPVVPLEQVKVHRRTFETELLVVNLNRCKTIRYSRV